VCWLVGGLRIIQPAKMKILSAGGIDRSEDRVSSDGLVRTAYRRGLRER
jgi:hypothetical protein